MNDNDYLENISNINDEVLKNLKEQNSKKWFKKHVFDIFQCIGTIIAIIISLIALFK